MPEFGYAGKILRVNLSSGNFDTLDTSLYASRFLGGRGFGAKLYYDETTPETRALDPENPLICVTGPLAGFTRFAGCRWQICGKSASGTPETFSFANLGGSWGAWLKYAGYDGLVFTGKAERPAVILIDEGKVSLHDAVALWGKTTHQAEVMLKSEFGATARVLTTGPAGENRVAFATVLGADNSSGSGGFGAVMGSKNLKAVVVKADRKNRPVPADPGRLDALATQVYELRTRNFEDYEHILPLKIRNKACYGCISGCTRGYYLDENGREFKSQCQAAGVYMGPAMRYYGGMNEKSQAVSRLATKLCDEYGLDTVVIAPMFGWLSRCFSEGILTEVSTGLPLTMIGSEAFLREFVRKVALREGFGDILANGTLAAAEHLGTDALKLLEGMVITKNSESLDYDPRMFLTNAIFYMMEPRRAIQLLHAITMPVSRWTNWRQGWENAGLSTEVFGDIAARHWGSDEAGNLASFEGKALAAKVIQDYTCAKESMIVCDLAWPIWQVRDIDNSIGNATLESRIISAVTGRDIDEAGLLEIGERNVNLQRAVMVRDGWRGREDDTLPDFIFRDPLGFVFVAPESEVPGPNGQIVSIKGNRLLRDDFEKLKDEYYRLRGWDVKTGLQTKEGMERLGLGDITNA